MLDKNKEVSFASNCYIKAIVSPYPNVLPIPPPRSLLVKAHSFFFYQASHSSLHFSFICIFWSSEHDYTILPRLLPSPHQCKEGSRLKCCLSFSHRRHCLTCCVPPVVCFFSPQLLLDLQSFPSILSYFIPIFIWIFSSWFESTCILAWPILLVPVLDISWQDLACRLINLI